MRISTANLQSVFGLLAALSVTQASSADIYRVDAVNGSISGDGSDWGADAYKYLRDAITAANSHSGADQIWVAYGYYYTDESSTSTGGDNDRSKSFDLTGDIVLYGGFAGINETAVNQRDLSGGITVLSGNINNAGAYTDNAYHVVKSTSSTGAAPILNGFTIQDGWADGSASADKLGAGIYASRGAFVNCVIATNGAYEGGGLYAIANGTLTLVACTFHDNTGRPGGGMSLGSSSTATVSNSLFFDNGLSTVDGGAAANTDGGTLYFNNCTFSQNVGADGEAVQGTGGALTIFRNCVLHGNGASGDGIAGGANDIQLLYTYYDDASPPTNWIVGAYNIFNTADPGFVNPSGNDFRMTVGSPTYNTANPAYIPDDTYDVDDDGVTSGEKAPDLDRTERVQACWPDMGAYEFVPCVGDVDFDGDVDAADLGILLGDWGTCVCFSDFNCDGEVDGADLAILLGGWSGEEDYPRSCSYSYSMAGGGQSVLNLATELGFGSVAELVEWMLSEMTLSEVSEFIGCYVDGC